MFLFNDMIMLATPRNLRIMWKYVRSGQQAPTAAAADGSSQQQQQQSQQSQSQSQQQQQQQSSILPESEPTAAQVLQENMDQDLDPNATDTFKYSTDSTGQKKYKRLFQSRSIIPFSSVPMVWVKDVPNNFVTRNAFQIVSSEKVFTLFCRTPEEKKHWMNLIEQQLQTLRKLPALKDAPLAEFNVPENSHVHKYLLTDQLWKRHMLNHRSRRLSNSSNSSSPLPVPGMLAASSSQASSAFGTSPQKDPSQYLQQQQQSLSSPTGADSVPGSPLPGDYNSLHAAAGEFITVSTPPSGMSSSNSTPSSDGALPADKLSRKSSKFGLLSPLFKKSQDKKSSSSSSKRRERKDSISNGKGAVVIPSDSEDDEDVVNDCVELLNFESEVKQRVPEYIEFMDAAEALQLQRQSTDDAHKEFEESDEYVTIKNPLYGFVPNAKNGRLALSEDMRNLIRPPEAVTPGHNPGSSGSESFAEFAAKFGGNIEHAEEGEVVPTQKKRRSLFYALINKNK